MNTVLTSLFGALKDDCLNLNYVRYNAGSSERSNPGFRLGASVPAYFDKDVYQRTILQKISDMRNGSLILEVFSNSPLQSLTLSGTTAGNPAMFKDNIASKDIGAFAGYLAKYIADMRAAGFTPSVLSPINEGFGLWGTKGNTSQEGSYWSGSARTALLKALEGYRTQLGESLCFGLCEENNVSDALRSEMLLTTTPPAELHVHTYKVTQFSQGIAQTLLAFFQDNALSRWALRTLARRRKQKLVVSEWGPGGPDVPTNNADPMQGISMLLHIINDLVTLQPCRYAVWQGVDGAGWGLIDNSTYKRTSHYYALLQLCNIMRPGVKEFTVERRGGCTFLTTVHGTLAVNASDLIYFYQLPEGKFERRIASGALILPSDTVSGGINIGSKSVVTLQACP